MRWEGSKISFCVHLCFESEFNYTHFTASHATHNLAMLNNHRSEVSHSKNFLQTLTRIFLIIFICMMVVTRAAWLIAYKRTMSVTAGLCVNVSGIAQSKEIPKKWERKFSSLNIHTFEGWDALCTYSRVVEPSAWLSWCVYNNKYNHGYWKCGGKRTKISFPTCTCETFCFLQQQQLTRHCHTHIWFDTIAFDVYGEILWGNKEKRVKIFSQ